MLKISFYCLILAFISISCEKQKKFNFFNSECMNDFKMPQHNFEIKKNYATASSELGPLKINANSDKYSFDLKIFQTFVTSEPTTVLGIQRPYKKLSFKLGIPYSYKLDKPEYLINFFLDKYKYTDDYTLENFIDSSFHKGNLPLNRHQLSLDTTLIPEENFEIVIWFQSCNTPVAWETGLSGIPEQQGSLECTSFLKNYEADSIHYQIQLKFDNISLKLVENLHLNDGEIGYDFKIPR
jgi:hypothetical protein